MANKTILYADDSATMRTIMEKTFAAEPVDVVAVPSGQAAIAKARELRPRVVIADVGMAGVSGYDVCKAVRGDEALAETPVLLLSGVSNPYDENRGREVGATEQMKKPFDTGKLIEKVDELAAAAPAPQVAPSPEPPAPEPRPAPVSPRPPSAPQPPVSPKPPPPPLSTPAAPSKTDAGRGAPSAGSRPKETMEFGRPAPPKPAPPEVKPIEIEESEEPEDAIQVGTLAELAQMDDKGGSIEPEESDDAIGIEEEPAAPAEPSPAPEPAEPAAEPVSSAASSAAETVVSEVEGLTSEQAAAIRKLTSDVVEQVVWEVVPDLAETIIREKLAELLEE